MENYINEDERDKQEQNDPDAQAILTPKGLFYIVLSEHFGVTDITDERIHNAWDDFEQWVRIHYGMGEFVGGIAFDKKGGEFVPMLQGPPPDIEDEE